MVSRAVAERIQEWGGIPLQCADGKQELFTRRDFFYWHEQYRNVDVTGEIVELSKWLRNNPQKRPPKQAMRGLISSWLKRKAR